MIRVLDKHIANLIAAGEVVDRPSSVVKELMENSIDAGATAITLEIERGGIDLIRVTDNGSGISGDDVRTALCRHATSKINSIEDLDAIYTLGFRGEALPAIASVSRIEISTRLRGEIMGVRLTAEGGEETGFEETGCPEGTVISVRDIFFNTPARQKFLKRDETEASQIAAVFDRVAFSHPEISFKFIKNGRAVANTPGNNTLIDVAYTLLGKDVSQNLREVDYAQDGITVSGLISNSMGARPNRNHQYFYINGRYVKSNTFTFALTEAFKGKIPSDKHPVCILNLKLDAGLIDINVHPAKLEVKFSDEKKIYDIFYNAIYNTFMNREKPVLNLEISENVKINPVEDCIPDTAPNTVSESEPKIPQPVRRWTLVTDKPQSNVNINIYADEEDEKEEKEQTDFSSIQTQTPSPIQNPISIEAPIIEVENIILETEKAENYRIAGELFKTYIIVELEETSYIIDKHAAHERILYEKLKNRKRSGDVQMILEPIVVNLTREEKQALLNSMEFVNSLGYQFEDFGQSSVLARGVPAEFNIDFIDIQSAVISLADTLLNYKKNPETGNEEILYDIACKAAIKGGLSNNPEEIAELVRIIRSDESLDSCPHGRPIFIKLTRGMLEKQFKRKN